MLTSDLDYPLPPDRIAQRPAEPRDAARLLAADPLLGPPLHRRVRDLPELLRRGDLLVLNRTRVIPARLLGRKDTGGACEILLIHPEPAPAADGGPAWRCLVRGKVRPGTAIALDGGLTATIAACHDDGERTAAFPAGTDVVAHCDRHGRIPLPPYIAREDDAADRERYQTVFGDRPGSVAAPTASLHLTTELLARIAATGVSIAYVDLAIGPGTFKPLDTERIEDFRIHAEWCACPAETAAAIRATRAAGGRVIAVGTTVVRTLESAADQSGGPAAIAGWSGWTRLYLHPPRRLSVVDGLMTNFHLPRSSLLLLVACMTGLGRLRALYAEAIARDYRFFSYGDAMLLLPGAARGEVPLTAGSDR